MIGCVTVAGTWGWQAPWRQPGSAWWAYLLSQGFRELDCDGRPFVWTTNLNGVRFWRRWTGGSDQRDWEAGGANLFAYIVPPLAPDRRVPPAQTHVICHSHALQVVLHACALGLKVNTLTDVAGPVRSDMRRIAEQARPNIRFWQHLHSDDSDRMQWLGGVFDGAFGIVRAHPLADLNIAVPKAGHSGLLHDPQWFPAWLGPLGTIRALATESDDAA